MALCDARGHPSNRCQARIGIPGGGVTPRNWSLGFGWEGQFPYKGVVPWSSSRGVCDAVAGKAPAVLLTGNMRCLSVIVRGKAVEGLNCRNLLFSVCCMSARRVLSRSRLL